MSWKQEIEKIDQFLCEAVRVWQRQPDQVFTSAFFQRWEYVCQPRPFKLPAKTIHFSQAGIRLTLMEKDGIGAFIWNSEEECPGFYAECRNVFAFYPLRIEDGSPFFDAPLIHETEGDFLSFGDRIEFMMDICVEFRKTWPSRNVLKIHKREYLELIDRLKDDYDPETIKIMRNLRITQIHHLISLVAKDMAEDEVSPQLVLPLDGNYALEEPIETMGAGADKPAIEIHPLTEQTPYQIQLLLQLLLDAEKILEQYEQQHTIALRKATLVQCEDDSQKDLLAIPLDTPLDIRENDTLYVHAFGDPGKRVIGKLKVIINDRNQLICEPQFAVQPALDELRKFYASTPRSGKRFIIDTLEVLIESFHKNQRFPSSSLNAILGIDNFAFQEISPPEGAQPQLDPSQLRAWANAISPANPFVLIQGPPGTGKSHLAREIICELLRQKKRVIFAAPSHTAVDNLCRKLLDLPLLRTGSDRYRIHPDVAAQNWTGDIQSIQQVRARQQDHEIVFAGTPLGLIQDYLLSMECRENGLFDVLVFDEAGMASIDEFLIIAAMAHRCVLIGDHQQLPPFPWPEAVMEELDRKFSLTRFQRRFITQSPLQWLIEDRNAPAYLLTSSYRCQNPRLIRFCSARFYNARVRTSASAEYYRLSYEERQQIYPP
ncbi:MAG: hypothetical protein D6820_13990, partial [Lentisphaerae bacterium]